MGAGGPDCVEEVLVEGGGISDFFDLARWADAGFQAVGDFVVVGRGSGAVWLGFLSSCRGLGVVAGEEVLELLMGIVAVHAKTAG